MDIYLDSRTSNTFNQLLNYRWHTGYPSMFYGQLQLEEDLLNLLNPASGAKVLDFGCGNGIVTGDYALMRPDCSFIGVSNAVTNLSDARRLVQLRKIKNVSFQYADGNGELPFKDNSFDGIIFTESICHVKDKRLLFSEFHRILKKGGKISGSDWFCKNSSYRNKIDRVYTTEMKTIGYYLKTLRATGFKVSAVRTFSPTTEFSLTDILTYPYNAYKYRKYSLPEQLVSVKETSELSKNLIRGGKYIDQAAKKGLFTIGIIFALSI